MDRSGDFVQLEAFMCHEGLEHWERGWSDAKKDWCCTYKSLGCRNRTLLKVVQSFDCNAGFARWEAGWSIRKKAWCCEHKKLGCPKVDHVSLTFVVSNLDFAKLKAEPFILDCFEVSVLEETVKQASHGVTDKKVVMDYWAGSGVQNQWSSTRRGVVVRSRITVPRLDDVRWVRQALGEQDFQLRLERAVRDCSGISRVSTPPIGVTHVAVEGAIVRPCTCAHGFAQHGEKCPHHGGELCMDCHKSFHLTSGYTCVKNRCTCSGGIQAEGTLCDRHEEEKCSSCFVGYHLHDDSSVCRPNKCTCADGFGAEGSECQMHGAEMCGSCYPGYHVDKDTRMCAPTVCACPFGEAALAVDCPEEGAHYCKSCKLGYYLTPDAICESNVCHCTGGTSAVGLLCTRHAGDICAWCEPGLHLMKNGSCSTRSCRCPHGRAAQGSRCSTNNAVVCEQCDKGYRLERGQCVGIPCGCNHGTPLSGASCTEPGRSICGKCHRGYRLEGFECVPNKCVCEHGEPAEGSQCLEAGQHSCGACHPGYRHNLATSNDGGSSSLAVTCIPNECECRDGDRDVGERATALTKPRCTIHGGNLCLSCIGHYHMTDDHQCVAKQCVCENGTPVDSSECQAHGARNCSSCGHGYFLASAPVPHAVGEQPELRDFRDGRKHCLPQPLTTSKPFNCQVALDNWERAWSTVKRHWCCANERLGCEPKLSGVDHCEGQRYNREQCGFVGCCMFNETSDSCLSAVGEKVCYPLFNIRSSEGYCLKSSSDDLTLSEIPVEVFKCDTMDVLEEWSPSPTGQIENPLGYCLEAAEPKHGAVSIVAKECSRSSPPVQKQILIYASKTGQFKTQGDLCLTVVLQEGAVDGAGRPQKDVHLKECSKSDTMQRWRVYEALKAT